MWSSTETGRRGRRLLRALPEVFLGTEAKAALDGRAGLLFGEKRHRQVDVLGLEPVPAAAGVAALVEARWYRGAVGGWRVVGLALPEPLSGAAEAELLEGLVAGDVVVTGGAGAGRVLVHRGDRLTPVR